MNELINHVIENVDVTLKDINAAVRKIGGTEYTSEPLKIKFDPIKLTESMKMKLALTLEVNRGGQLFSEMISGVWQAWHGAQMQRPSTDRENEQFIEWKARSIMRLEKVIGVAELSEAGKIRLKEFVEAKKNQTYPKFLDTFSGLVDPSKVNVDSLRKFTPFARVNKWFEINKPAHLTEIAKLVHAWMIERYGTPMYKDELLVGYGETCTKDDRNHWHASGAMLPGFHEVIAEQKK